MRPTVRSLVLALCATTALATAACSKESDRAADPTSADASSPGLTATETASDGATGTATGGAGRYPAFEPADYTYRLEVMCFCPMAGPVQVVVEDGRVSRATLLESDTAGTGGVAGTDAPEFARLTINDVIAQANAADATNAESVDVTWPDGQAWPDTVAIDRIDQATDDEVTYTIKDVRVG